MFYCKPKANFDDEAWYLPLPVGHNLLVCRLKDMFMVANLDCEGIQNHSLRATSISCIYKRGVTEKIIMKRSGHQSIGGYALMNT